MGRVNRSKTGMNGTKPNRTNRSPSASMAGNRSAPGAASTLGRGGEVGSDRITRVNRHPLADSVQVGSGTVLLTEASPGEKEISRFTRILRRFRGGSPRGFVRFAKSALGIERSQTPSQRYSHLVILEEIPPETAPGGWGMTMS